MIHNIVNLQIIWRGKFTLAIINLAFCFRVLNFGFIAARAEFILTDMPSPAMPRVSIKVFEIHIADEACVFHLSRLWLFFTALSSHFQVLHGCQVPQILPVSVVFLITNFTQITAFLISVIFLPVNVNLLKY